MTESEISERFNVTRRTARRWRKDGFPPGVSEIVQLHEGTHPAWPGFKIQDGVVHTPNGYSLSANEIQLSPWIIANYRTLFASEYSKNAVIDKQPQTPKQATEQTLTSVESFHLDSVH